MSAQTDEIKILLPPSMPNCIGGWARMRRMRELASLQERTGGCIGRSRCARHLHVDTCRDVDTCECTRPGDCMSAFIRGKGGRVRRNQVEWSQCVKEIVSSTQKCQTDFSVGLFVFRCPPLTHTPADVNVPGHSADNSASPFASLRWPTVFN